MPDRILTSHAGSLPRPEELVAMNLKRGLGELEDEAGYQAKLTQAVTDVVAERAAESEAEPVSTVRSRDAGRSSAVTLPASTRRADM